MAALDGNEDDLVWRAPGWVLPVGALVAVAVLVTGSLVFWRAMGTDLTDAITEAFGVVLGALVFLSGIGAFHRAAVESRSVDAR